MRLGLTQADDNGGYNHRKNEDAQEGNAICIASWAGRNLRRRDCWSGRSRLNQRSTQPGRAVHQNQQTKGQSGCQRRKRKFHFFFITKGDKVSP